MSWSLRANRCRNCHVELGTFCLCYNRRTVRRSFGFWFVYALAWLPFAASYVTFYVGHLGRTVADGITTSLTGVIPAALLGIGVVAICDRFPWSRKRRVWFVSVHLVLAICYFQVWMSAVRILFGLEQKIENAVAAGKGPSTASFDAGMITGLMIYATIAAIVYSIDAMTRLRAEEARVAQLESLRTRAELETLRAQLNPHFLFNTLHSLMALIRHDAKAAEDALEKLAVLLRHTLMTSSQTEDVALRDELDFVRNYLSLERLRLGDRLQVQESADEEALNCVLPPLTLQPLVENSIKHAIGSQPQGGILKIKAERYGGVLRLEVLDNGPGANINDLAQSGGLGLGIVKQRLSARYNGQAKVQIDTQPGHGFAVRIEIPQASSS
jgi:sensor histidine kinase YesM